MSDILAVPSTRSGMAIVLLKHHSLIMSTRLDGAAFRARKDQRQAVNRFTQYILGQDYMSLAARLCPKTKEYVHVFNKLLHYTRPTNKGATL